MWDFVTYILIYCLTSGRLHAVRFCQSMTHVRRIPRELLFLQLFCWHMIWQHFLFACDFSSGGSFPLFVSSQCLVLTFELLFWAEAWKVVSSYRGDLEGSERLPGKSRTRFIARWSCVWYRFSRFSSIAQVLAGFWCSQHSSSLMVPPGAPCVISGKLLNAALETPRKKNKNSSPCNSGEAQVKWREITCASRVGWALRFACWRFPLLADTRVKRRGR